jgi:hypothetical protein
MPFHVAIGEAVTAAPLRGIPTAVTEYDTIGVPGSAWIVHMLSRVQQPKRRRAERAARPLEVR